MLKTCLIYGCTALAALLVASRVVGEPLIQPKPPTGGEARLECIIVDDEDAPSPVFVCAASLPQPAPPGTVFPARLSWGQEV